MSDSSLPKLTLQPYLDQAFNKQKGKGWIIPYLPGSLKLALSNEQREVKVLAPPARSPTRAPPPPR